MRLWLLRLAGIGLVFLAGAIVLAAGLPDAARLLALRPVLPGERPVAAVIGGTAPEFNADNTLGDPIHLNALRGSPVILNFWATWCEPCRVELPELQQLYAASEDVGLRVLAVNVGEPPAVFVPWAVERGVTFDLLADPERRLQALYRVRGVPQTIVIDAAGTIQAIHYGPVDPIQLARSLEAP